MSYNPTISLLGVYLGEMKTDVQTIPLWTCSLMAHCLPGSWKYHFIRLSVRQMWWCEWWVTARELRNGWGDPGNKRIPIFKVLETLGAQILNGFPRVKAVHRVVEPRVWATVVIFLAQWRGYLQSSHLHCPQISTSIPCLCPQSIGSSLPATVTLRYVGSIKI